MFIRSGYNAQTRRVAGGSGTEYHHLAADVLGGLRDAPDTAAAESGGLGFPDQAPDAEDVELDAVLVDRACATGVDGLATALEHDPRSLAPHRRRQARVDETVALL